MVQLCDQQGWPHYDTQEVKSTFIELLDQGTKYIPMDPSCDNFDTETGCQ